MEILPLSTSNNTTVAASHSLPHAYAQSTKTLYQDKAYQDKDCQGRLLASFQDDAKYKNVGQDTRSQDGKDDDVVEVSSKGMVSTRKVSRRHLLKSSGLRPRDIRSVDPSLWLTNTMPSLLVRENAILLNLGSLRAIAMQESVFIFNFNRRGGKAFIDDLLPRLNPKSMIGGGVVMPFELEVVEAALNSRIQHFEHRLMDLDPHVQDLLKVLPNRLTAGILEQLRICKQTLVELGSKAGALRQMLLDMLEDSQEIRRLCIVGRNCILGNNSNVECSVPLDKQIAEEEEEEIEMLLENYLHRCESCHNQAERLLDSAREMEDSIAVNLSSRRLQVSRFELLLQVGTFCLAVGALVSGIFGMNLRSYLEEHASHLLEPSVLLESNISYRVVQHGTQTFLAKELS
uniref:Magnesium transporter n=1 Tax=Tanacetum cinerariifolium TaxID=118510 RepID=A0A6L2KDB3_TANCI|nr:magnesium transporter MRS2-11, chloroplastic-like [Tanacetum cinerariifolium]